MCETATLEVYIHTYSMEYSFYSDAVLYMKQ